MGGEDDASGHLCAGNSVIAGAVRDHQRRRWLRRLCHPRRKPRRGRLSAWRDAFGDGRGEPGMVPLVLDGVAAGELADRRRELGALAEVAGDGQWVAGAGVRPGQRLPACGGELDQARGDQLGARNNLHVTELPHVVVLPVQRAPADEDVSGALEQPLSVDYPSAVVAVAAGLGVSLVGRRAGLLDLQEQ